MAHDTEPLRLRFLFELFGRERAMRHCATSAATRWFALGSAWRAHIAETLSRAVEQHVNASETVRQDR